MKFARRSIVAAVLAVVFVGLPAFAQDAGKSKGELSDAESKAIGTLRSFASAEATFFAAHKRYATISELAAAEYMNKSFSEGSERGGYRFTSVGVGNDTFDIRAEPTTPDAGRYSFNVIEDWVIRFEKGLKAPGRAEGKVVGVAPFE